MNGCAGALISALLLFLLLPGCVPTEEAQPCEAQTLPSRQRLLCPEQFRAQAARPKDSALPGAFTVKTVIDQADPQGGGDKVHFQDTTAYPLHRAFAVAHLDYPRGMPFAGEYFLPQRRLLLGAVTRYEEPDVWAYEIAPYDTATPELVTKAFRLLRDAAFFGQALRLHPTSQEQLEQLAGRLPADVGVVTTAELYAATRYQPLNLGTTIGQVRLVQAAELSRSYVSPREIAVLDRAPPDISVVAGIVTAEPQTPLSHVNVLSQQRGTPNMGLRDAMAVFAPLSGQWVRLRVGAFAYEVTPVSATEAEAFWEAHRPGAVTLPQPDYGRTDLPAVDTLALADLPTVGGKAAHYAELRKIAGVRVPAGFAVPVFYHREFMQAGGFDREVAGLLADPRFRGDGVYRRQQLETLQARMLAAPVSPPLLLALGARLGREFPGVRMRFRSSTNAEDLQGHSGAGLYQSESGQPSDDKRPVDRALKTVWASLFSFRAFEEREYVRIDHGAVAMAVLVHPAYLDEAANGVAITNNPFDPHPDGEDAFYINVQAGEADVVSPDPAFTADQLLYFYFHNGQPATYFARSNLVPAGATVLSRKELYELGTALSAIRDHFTRFYRPADGVPLGMDVEFKLTPDRHIEIKQARPYPGRGRAPEGF